MKYAKQGNGEGNPAADATPLLAVPDAGSQVGSKDAGQGDYQKYMKQYAGDYMKYANQGGSKGSSQQGGDYQQYMKQYAGDYMKQGGSKGGDYQQYMKQYAGDYQKYMHQADTNQGSSLPAADASGAAASPLLAIALSGADACNTTQELDAWRKEQEAHLKYVPKEYRHFPMDSIEKAYKKNLARIAAANNETKADTEGDAAASDEASAAIDLAATDTTQPRLLAALAVAGISVPAMFAFLYRAFVAPASIPEYVQRPPAEV
eukprot:TRINITY_DN2133_c0_g1_i3.p1 TRINITY_DN2133_c0_g1~~TRINITY_DN2133_c0_g1_i3.p1  ORF type:complete len:298 (+),score=85.97 TRINITY_DN2133_c0_g1_i3:111-896(+)